jgi:hypothetical protein
VESLADNAVYPAISVNIIAASFLSIDEGMGKIK